MKLLYGHDMTNEMVRDYHYGHVDSISYKNAKEWEWLRATINCFPSVSSYNGRPTLNFTFAGGEIKRQRDNLPVETVDYGIGSRGTDLDADYIEIDDDGRMYIKDRVWTRVILSPSSSPDLYDIGNGEVLSYTPDDAGRHVFPRPKPPISKTFVVDRANPKPMLIGLDRVSDELLQSLRGGVYDKIELPVDGEWKWRRGEITSIPHINEANWRNILEFECEKGVEIRQEVDHTISKLQCSWWPMLLDLDISDIGLDANGRLFVQNEDESFVIVLSPSRRVAPRVVSRAGRTLSFAPDDEGNYLT